MLKVVAYVFGMIVSLAAFAGAADAATVKCKKAKGAWAKGSCAYAHSNDPEGWVRASASLDTETGVVKMKFSVETDSTASGPCGRMTVLLRDGQGRDLATVKMAKKACRGGKSPGKAARTVFSFQKAVPVDVASRTSSVVVLVEKAGKRVRIWDIPLSVVEDGIKLALTAVPS